MGGADRNESVGSGEKASGRVVSNGSVHEAGASEWSSKVIKKAEPLPVRIGLLGGAGIGKTSFARSMYKTILIDYDGGAEACRVDRVTGPKTWAGLLQLLRDIAANPSGYKTVAIDTLDGAEIACISHVCQAAKKESLGDFSFGAGYEALAAEWRILLGELDEIRAKGLYICLLSHSIVRQIQDPRIGPYDQLTSGLQRKTWAATVRWVDILGFACFEAARVKDERRAIVTGERVLHTTSASGFESKNRFGMPAQLPLSWEAVEAAIRAYQASPDDVVARIEKIASGTEFVEKAKEYVLGAKGDVRMLLQIEDALKTKLAEVGGSK